MIFGPINRQSQPKSAITVKTSITESQTRYAAGNKHLIRNDLRPSTRLLTASDLVENVLSSVEYSCKTKVLFGGNHE